MTVIEVFGVYFIYYMTTIRGLKPNNVPLLSQKGYITDFYLQQPFISRHNFTQFGGEIKG